MELNDRSSLHWTTDELVQEVYGVGPNNGHLAGCPECQAKLERIRAFQDTFVANDRAESVSNEFLAAQRRAIYQRITEPVRWWQAMVARQVASATLVLVLLGGGLVAYHNYDMQRAREAQLSDAQLAREVSVLSQDLEPTSTAPLQGLFN